MSEKIYFAHAVNSYGTDIEQAAETLVARVLCDGDRSKVENPNQAHHQEGYNRYAERKEQAGKDHKGMSYFYDEVLPECSGCVAMPFLDGRFGLGVAGEAHWFAERDMPVWLMEPTREAQEITLGDLGQFIVDPVGSGLFCVRFFTPEELPMLQVEKDIGSSLVVPHEETRLRTWFVYGQKERPYVTAHLAPVTVPEGFYP